VDQNTARFKVELESVRQLAGQVNKPPPGDSHGESKYRCTAGLVCARALNNALIDSVASSKMILKQEFAKDLQDGLN